MSAPEADPWSLPSLTQRVALGIAERVRDNCGAPGTVLEAPPRTTCRTSLSTAPTEGGPLPMIISTRTDVHTQCRARHAEDAATIRQLRTDLARAIAQRAALAPRAVHWFVDDGAGYCLACALPERNVRHCKRAA